MSYVHSFYSTKSCLGYFRRIPLSIPSLFWKMFPLLTCKPFSNLCMLVKSMWPKISSQHSSRLLNDSKWKVWLKCHLWSRRKDKGKRSIQLTGVDWGSFFIPQPSAVECKTVLSVCAPYFLYPDQVNRKVRKTKNLSAVLQTAIS